MTTANVPMKVTILHCPVCNKTLAHLEADKAVVIRIKCPRCREVAEFQR